MTSPITPATTAAAKIDALEAFLGKWVLCPDKVRRMAVSINRNGGSFHFLFLDTYGEPEGGNGGLLLRSGRQDELVPQSDPRWPRAGGAFPRSGGQSTAMIDPLTADSIGVPVSSLVPGGRPQYMEECVGKIVRCTIGAEIDRLVISIDDAIITFRDVHKDGTLGVPCDANRKANACIFVGEWSHFMRAPSGIAPIMDLAGNPLSRPLSHAH